MKQSTAQCTIKVHTAVLSVLLVFMFTCILVCVVCTETLIYTMCQKIMWLYNFNIMWPSCDPIIMWHLIMWQFSIFFKSVLNLELTFTWSKIRWLHQWEEAIVVNDQYFLSMPISMVVIISTITCTLVKCGTSQTIVVRSSNYCLQFL